MGQLLPLDHRKHGLFIQGHQFRALNLCFHFKRDNVYSPWIIIGTIITCYQWHYARYDEDYDYLVDEFYKEIKKAKSETIASSYEWLNEYRRRHQNINDVICPVIIYYSNDKLQHISKFLFYRYVKSLTVYSYMRIKLMLMAGKVISTAFFPPSPLHEESLKLTHEFYKERIRSQTAQQSNIGDKGRLAVVG